MTKWTRIAAGVSGTFGDALPIEGLIESANETAKVGKVTASWPTRSTGPESARTVLTRSWWQLGMREPGTH